MDFKIRESRKEQGRRKLHREREEYFRPVDQGVSSREACRIVGISRRSGKRWRNGTAPAKNRPGLPAHRVRASRVVSSSRCLAQEERLYIADRVREKSTVRKTAADLRRSPSTISHEIRRNRHPVTGQYRPYAAQARAKSRRPHPKPHRMSCRCRRGGSKSRTCPNSGFASGGCAAPVGAGRPGQAPVAAGTGSGPGPEPMICASRLRPGRSTGRVLALRMTTAARCSGAMASRLR